MLMPFEALIKLDDIELSDHFRAPVSVEREGRMVEVELASGKIKRYWKGSARSTFSISWQWLPSLDESTIDGLAGRDTLRDEFKDSQVTHTLLFRDEDGDEEQYTVWVDSYSEEITRRAGDDFFWTVNLSLREQ